MPDYQKPKFQEPAAGSTASVVSPAYSHSRENFYAASRDLGLNVQEANLYRHHLNNIDKGKTVVNEDGTISTVMQAVIENGGSYYNVPTIWDGKALDPKDVMNKIGNAGLANWPSYKTPEEADARYEKMHKYMERDVTPQMERSPVPTSGVRG